MKNTRTGRAVLTWMALLALAFVILQMFFLLRIALMAKLAPESTAFQRSEVWRIASSRGSMHWQQQWVDYARISDNLKRAVIASEDDSFINHDGVDWDAVEKAWDQNIKAQASADRRAKTKAPKIVGGSTITQQLAKNLFLAGERTMLRKAEEFVLTMMLELLLDKERILEIYLNCVEWGDGVFGAEAAARHYYRKSAAELTAYEAARLAVMLPRPKFYEKMPASPYLTSRAEVITMRMPNAQLP